MITKYVADCILDDHRQQKTIITIKTTKKHDNNKNSNKNMITIKTTKNMITIKTTMITIPVSPSCSSDQRTVYEAARCFLFKNYNPYTLIGLF